MIELRVFYGFGEEHHLLRSNVSPRGKSLYYKSLEIPMRNQKSRTPKPEIPLMNQKSRTLNAEVIYHSFLEMVVKIYDPFNFP